MSLDVMLRGEPRMVDCTCQCGHQHKAEQAEEIFSANITHNLSGMAGEAGIYKCVWCPNENGMGLARDVIPTLVEGIALLKSDPKRFEPFSAKNGWGTYAQFVPWLERYLQALEAHPDAFVSTCK